MYNWIRNISTKFELFIYRGLIESGISCCLLIFCIYGDLGLINNSGTKLEDNNGLLFLFDNKILNGNANIMFLSLFIKIFNCLICWFIFWLNTSHSYEVYTHICDCVPWVADISRQFITVVIVLYSIDLYFFYHDYNDKKHYIDNTDDYLILLQLYFYPSLYVIFYLIGHLIWNVWDNTYHSCGAGHGNFVKFGYYVSFVFILAPFSAVIGLCVLQIMLMIVIDSAYLSLMSDFLFQKSFNVHSDVLDYRDAKDKHYKAYYYLMNKICYFLIQDVSFDRLHLCRQTKNIKGKGKGWCKCIYTDASFYQKVGVINYEILQACIATKQFEISYKSAMQRKLKKQERKRKKKSKNSKDGFQLRLVDADDNVNDDDDKNDHDTDNQENKNDDNRNNNNNGNHDNNDDFDDDDDDDDITMHMDLCVKFLDELKQAENENLMSNIDDSYFFTNVDSNEGHSPYYLSNIVKYVYVGLYKLFWEFLFDIIQPGENVLKIDNSPKRIMFHLFIIAFIISRINLMLYPFYFLIFLNYKKFNQYNQEISNFEFFIEMMIWFTIGLYLYVFWLWYKYLIPLYHKLSYILPWDRLTNKKGQYYQLETLFELFKDADIKVCDQIFEQILMHCTALKVRPIKEKIVMECLTQSLGKDISRIVMQYLPIREYIHLGSL